MAVTASALSSRGLRPEHVHPEDLVRRRVGDHLDEPLGLTRREGAAGSGEGERPRPPRNARLVELGLGPAHPRDLGMGVDHPGHGTVVDPAPPARDALRDRNPVLRGAVGEHRSRGAVADRPHVRAARAAEFIHPYEPPIVTSDARRLEAELLGDGPASDRDHEPVHLDPVGSVRVLVMDHHRFVSRTRSR